MAALAVGALAFGTILQAGAAEKTEAAGAGGGPPPFTAVYALEWHGITAGYSTLSLAEQSPGRYVYSSVNRARGLFRLAFPDAISERSTFRIVDGQVVPLEYQENDGTRRRSQNVMLEFDWKALEVRGNAGSKTVEKPITVGTQDPLSVQVALMRQLAAGLSPEHFLLFDKTEAAQYRYTREGEAELDTALGRIETVIYRSDRPDSDRVMRFWLAPSLGYLPVRAERTRRGSTEFELRIRELTPNPGAPSQPST